MIKIEQLKPNMRDLTIAFKVLEKDDIKEITLRRDNQDHRICEATVGDETGTIVVPLWDENIEDVEIGKTYKLENGYTGVYRSHLRLNVGRHGKISEFDDEIEEVDKDTKMSAKEIERKKERRPRKRREDSRPRRRSGGRRRQRVTEYVLGDTPKERQDRLEEIRDNMWHSQQ